MRRRVAARRAVAGLAAIAGTGLLMPSTPVGADGTEMLGPPTIAIAAGSGVVTEGTGLFVQPSAVSITVPAGATVEQALLYWQGEHRSGTGDDTIEANGQSVTGQRIGGPTFFYDNGGAVYTTSYRADITARGIVRPGANNVSLGGLNFDVGNNGASLVVIYDDGSGIKEIGVRDGVDNAFKGFPGARQTTVPQTFPVNPAAEPRQAQIDLIVGSVDSNRGSIVRITSGGQVFVSNNLLGDTDDREWDDVTVPFTIPAGATSVTVEIISENVGSKFAASLTWVAAVLSQPDLCPEANVPARTRGSAFGLDARVLGSLIRVEQAGSVASALPEGPAGDADKPLPVSVAGLVNANILATASSSALDPSTTTSSASLADVSALGGLVRASTVRAVSQSTASTHGASYNSDGSTIVGLTVGGAAVNVAPNVKVAVKLLGITIAELHVMEEKGSSSFADGVSKASHSMNALRLVLLKSYLGHPAGTTVTLSHADSEAQSPISGCPDAKTVSGEAFTAYVDGNIAGKDLVDVKVGDAVLPSVGGWDSDGTVVHIPGVATSVTAANTTSGSLTPHPNASSRSIVQGVSILNGLIKARVVDVKATSTADGTTAGTRLSADFVDLVVGGKLYASADIRPNSHVIVDLGSLGYVSVFLNEQVKNTRGGTDTEGTVNAIHARVYTLKGLLTGEVVVASAHSDAHA